VPDNFWRGKPQG